MDVDLNSENRHYPPNLQPYRNQRRYAGTKIELDEKQGDKTIMQFNQIQTDKALDSFSRTAL